MTTTFVCEACGLAWTMPGQVEPPRLCLPCEREARMADAIDELAAGLRVQRQTVVRWVRRGILVLSPDGAPQWPYGRPASVGGEPCKACGAPIPPARKHHSLCPACRAPAAETKVRPPLDESCELAPPPPPPSERLLGREGDYTYVQAGRWVYQVDAHGRRRRIETVATWPASTTAKRLAQPRRGAPAGTGGDLWPIR